jgi:hypothetical protein
VFAQGHTFEVDAGDAIGTRHGLGWWASVSLLLRDRGLGDLGGRSVCRTNSLFLIFSQR